MAQQTPAKQLFDLLVSRNFDPELLNTAGKPASDPSETEVFSFDFVTESGNNYGTVVIMLGEDNELQVYFGDNVGRTMEGQDKNEWYAFLEQLKHFSTKNLMDFGLKNLNRLRYSMQGQAAIKEGLFESWRGTKTVSYNDRPEAVRLMIRHKKPIGEGDARYRYVESLYVETADGERFKLPFTKLSGGRAMVEHVRNGGRPYDARGQHIAAVVEELNVLSRFRRANQGKIFEGDTETLISETNAYYENLNRVLKGLGTHRGYTNYFESWNPAEITEQDVVIESIKNLFVRETIDTRIEQALPVLAKIQKQGQAMKEINMFEAWANRLTEGTWSTPETPEQKQQLVDLLSKDFPVVADALNATEQLYDLLGDDVLFDQLEKLADQDANADARQTILDRMMELGQNPDIADVISQLNIDTDPADELDADSEEQVNEMLPALGAALGRAAVGAVGHAVGNKIEDMLDSDDEEVDEGLGGSYFVVFDDGRQPYGPVDQQQAQAIAQRIADAEIIPASQLATYQQANRKQAMKGSEPMEADDLSTFEGKCNMTAEGEECPMHGLKECGYMEDLDTDGIMMTKASNMSSESADPMLSRLKTLSGIIAR
jgi:hypothetical protein